MGRFQHFLDSMKSSSSQHSVVLRTIIRRTEMIVLLHLVLPTNLKGHPPAFLSFRLRFNSIANDSGSNPDKFINRPTSKRAVFAHYMIGRITDDHARQDIQKAHDLGLDAFVLNVDDASQDWVKRALQALFRHAEKIGFKLLVSMDLAGMVATTPDHYSWILERYCQSPAYFRFGGVPMVSTYSSGGLQVDVFRAWRQKLSTPIYFVPDLDDTQGYYEAHPGWWHYWGDLVDGVMSWESAWPVIGSKTSEGSVERDTVVLAGASSRSKSYMIGLSPLQYKAAYGTNLYRRGGTSLPTRMQNILNMTDPSPNFVQYLTWNDAPESHYIGQIWPECNDDPEPKLYAHPEAWSHTAWQPLLTSFVIAFKSGRKTMVPPSGELAIGAIWYHVIHHGTTRTSPSTQNEYSHKPAGFQDARFEVNWTIVLCPDHAAASGYIMEIYSGDERIAEETLHAGLNFGSCGRIQRGKQRMVVRECIGGKVVMCAEGGREVEDVCASWNLNYQVVGLEAV